ncbi:hypothetical protein [Neisseria elongata]|uniref:hypothetical protein n=1 Tax=Neisseria elongata TaxID=495 RepID=UPI0024B1A246|nr:hypothetical protein [Neisseria elongata]
MPNRVIPAQAGIQTLVFQEYLKIAAIPNPWIPACAGMMVWAFFFEFTVKRFFPARIPCFSDGLLYQRTH